MTDLYPLLFYSGLVGGLVLLVLGSIPSLRQLRRPLTALTLTLLTCLWVLLPPEGRWVFSVWSANTVGGGQFVLDMVPATWWSGLLIGVVFTGAAWYEVATRGGDHPLDGWVHVTALMVLWATLLAGSVLTTLAFWAVADLIWCVSGLMSGEDGERVVFGTAIRGVASLIVWVVSLYQLREGTSELWWLMQPRAPLLNLLYVAALMRVGAYPFQIVFRRNPEHSRALRLVYVTGGITGVALLFRLLRLPGTYTLPQGFVIWVMVSATWCGVMALTTRGRRALLWVGYAIQLAMVAGGLANGTPEVLLLGMAGWLSAVVLMMQYSGWERRAVFTAWPTWIAVLYLLGMPPSPMGSVLTLYLGRAGWGERAILIVGIIAVVWVAFHELAERAPARTVPPWPWLRLPSALAIALVLSVHVVLASVTEIAPFSALGLGLWFAALLLGAVLARWGQAARTTLQQRHTILELIDLQWLYRALWQGTEHMLSFVRVTAGVVEGSGALLWSLLIVVLALLVAGRL